MRRAPPISLALAGLVLAMACGDVPTETQVTPLSPQFAKDKTCPGHPSCQEEPPSVIVEYPAAGPGQGIYGDAANGSGTYTPGVCGVYSRLFVDGSGDAVMDPDSYYRRKDGDCLEDDRFGLNPRYIVLDYSNCVYPANCEGLGVRAGSWFMNVFDVHSISTVGETRERGAQFNTGECAHGLRFGDDESTSEQVVSNVRVRLIQESPRRWEVWTEEPHVAVCRPDQHGNKPGMVRRYFRLPFKLWLTEDSPSP